jgi:hypothetical protein
MSSIFYFLCHYFVRLTLFEFIHEVSIEFLVRRAYIVQTQHKFNALYMHRQVLNFVEIAFANFGDETCLL